MDTPDKERQARTIANSPWPAELDALIAAPEHHTLLFENERIRVLETRIPPGERTAVHTHCWPSSIYVKSGTPFIRYDGDGQVLVDSQKAGVTLESGMAAWSGPLPPHSLENVGATVLNVISVEIKG